VSQIYKNSSGGSIPPSVATSYVTNFGTAIPAANLLYVFGGSGIQTYADPDGGNQLFIKLQNSTTDTGVTVDDETIDLSTIDCSNPGTYFFTTQIVAFSIDGTEALGGVLYTTAISNNGILTIVDDTDSISHETGGLSGPSSTIDYEIVASGSNAILQVTGQDTFTLDWGAITIYVFRGF
jgi:hypothetical protein